MNRKEELLQKLSDGVVEMEDEETARTAGTFIGEGYPALDGMIGGLVDGMNRAGKMYDEEEYFVADLLLCSDAMYAGMDVLRPHLPSEDAGTKKHRVVIGVIEGDTHDIGKNLVKIMLETAGFEIYDLGRDVPVENFIQKTKEVGASLVCLSTLMTTTMAGMKRVIDKLGQENMRETVKVMVGGGPLSQAFADRIGADGYSANAVEAAKLAKRLVEPKSPPQVH